MSTIIYSAKLAIFSTSYMHVAGSAFAYIQKQFSVTANYNGKTLKAENQTSIFDGSSKFVDTAKAKATKNKIIIFILYFDQI